jgi:hypothetical protein
LNVLAKLAARGNVWPAACSVAIRDLQKTLAESQVQRTTGLTAPSSTSNGLGSYGESSTAETNSVPVVQQPAAENSFAMNMPIDRQAPDAQFSHGGDGQQFLPFESDTSIQGSMYPQSQLGGSWLELGMSIETELPLVPFSGIDPFEGFDIPFWMEQEHAL